MDPSLSQIIDVRLVALLKAAVHIRYLCFPASISDSALATVMKMTTLHEVHATSVGFGNNLSASFLHDHPSHLALTLEALDLDYFPLDILPSSITTRFTAVRSLKFQTDYIPDSDTLAILLHLFPNLDGTLVLGFLVSNLPEDVHLTMRARSEEAQRTHTWPGLDLLAWESHCMVPPEAADRLTHLVLFTNFEARYKWRAPPKRRKSINWDRFFDRVLDAVKHLRLAHLRVVFHCSAVYQAVPDTSGFTLGALATTASEEGLAQAGQQVPGALQMALVNAWRRWAVRDHRDASADAAPPLSESNAMSGSSLWTELSSDEAHGVMVREELHLSSREEADGLELEDRKLAVSHRRRLRMSPVVLTLPDSLETFHKFIFADPTSRAPYLYGLSVSPHLYHAAKGDPNYANHLVAILEAAIHLEYLYFPASLGLSVCATVAKMTTLRELTIHSNRGLHMQQQPEALNNLLTALQSPLQYLSIADYRTEQISASFVHDHLFQLSPTLESLRFQDLFFDIPPSSVTTQFTALRSLSIEATLNNSRFYRLDVLLRLFPNLDDTLFLNGFMPSIDQYSELREQSKEAQMDYTWKGLDRVIYSAEMAFMMALRCPIHCMEIYGLVLQKTPYLAVALRDNCPRHLFLPMAFFGYDDLQHLDALFPPEAAGTLTHLVLFADTNVYRRCRPTGKCNSFSWNQFIDGLIGSVKHLRLTHLRVIFHKSVLLPLRSDTSGPSGTRDSDEDFALNIVHDADIHLAAIQLVDMIQSLRYVLFTTCGVCQYDTHWKYWHSSKAWRVAGHNTTPDQPSDTELKLLEISGEAAEMVIDEEELHMGRREGRMVASCIKNASK
ncbi:hypothetical protein V8D89_007937 [Ganoderma adspersum]